MTELKKLESFFEIIRKFDKNLTFKILEIGAHPYGEFNEGFHILLDHFPGSEIYAFEVDKEECEKLNKSCKKGMKFFPIALGKKRETRKFYETYMPVCSSLYKPKQKFLELYNNLNIAYFFKKKKYKIFYLIRRYCLCSSNRSFLWKNSKLY